MVNDILLNNARWCFENLGFSFTPLRGKVPQNKAWQDADRESLEDLQNWASSGNLGLRTGKASGDLLVVDLDVNKPDYCVETVKTLNLPETVTVKTGSGGYHLYYKMPAGIILKNSANKIAPCVDTRGIGGQVVFAGSIHPETKQPYFFMPGKAPWEIGISELPACILALINREASIPSAQNSPQPVISNHGQTGNDKYAQSALMAEMSKVSSAGEGARNHTLNSAAYSLGQLVAGGVLDEATVRTSLASAALICGLSQSEAEHTIQSGLTAGLKEPRGVPVRPAARPPATAIPAPVVAPNPAGERQPQPAELSNNNDEDDIYEIDESGNTVVKLGCRDPQTGRLVLAADKTPPTAQAFIKEFATIGNHRKMHYYAKELFAWRNNRYEKLEDAEIKGILYDWLFDAVTYKKIDGALRLTGFSSNAGTVKGAKENIEAKLRLPAVRQAPFYVSGNTKLDPKEVLCCRNCNLHIPTMDISQPDPDLFNFNSLEFDFDPDAEHPLEWYKFLKQMWPDDPEAIQLLKEWFGYCLTPDTSQQKMLFIQGPKRSGKGTIAKVLQELVGLHNYVAPTTSNLASKHGMQDLLGKSLACVSDARFSGPDLQTVVERLLTISGEDTVTVERKFIDAITVRMPVRFMFLSNELPQLKDAGGALPSRFLVLTQSHSFYGQEDPYLIRRLLAELSGILLWALEGWHDLRNRGRFKVPESSESATKEIEAMASNAKAFVQECCEQGKGFSIEVQDLYDAFCKWAEKSGIKHVPPKPKFGKDLRAAVAGLRVGQRNTGVRYYKDIRLKMSFATEML